MRIGTQGFCESVVLDISVYFGGVFVGRQEFTEGFMICGGVRQGYEGGDSGGGS